MMLVPAEPKAGAVLKVTAGYFAPSTITRSYQWYRDGLAIPGATHSSYTLTNSDRAKRITVELSASRAGYMVKLEHILGPVLPSWKE
jgi:hypothetical protein